MCAMLVYNLCMLQIHQAYKQSSINYTKFKFNYPVPETASNTRKCIRLSTIMDVIIKVIDAESETFR